MERLRTHLLVLLTLALVLCAPALGQEQDTPVKIGVLANRGEERYRQQWGPTAEYLTSQIPGHSFTIVPLDFEGVDPAVERGEVDFILTNPAFYVELEELHRVNRIATLKNRRATGVYTVFGGTHDAVACAVHDGKVDAGTVRTDTLERMAAEKVVVALIGMPADSPAAQAARPPTTCSAGSARPARKDPGARPPAPRSGRRPLGGSPTESTK